jgi:aryl-alcohol dehydrogenase-like predicted oxidoreductase
MSGLGVSAADTKDAIKLMRTAYGAYKNDELLGGALQVVIATKFGFEFVANGGQSGMSSRPERPV